MSSPAKSKRLAPDAYDHLWSLLPVFIAFFAVLVFAATADDRPLPSRTDIDSQPASIPNAEPSPQLALDPSPPSAASAQSAQPDEVSDHVACF
jgi:hypothetical protein